MVISHLFVTILTIISFNKTDLLKIFTDPSMKIEIYVKGNSTHLQVPAERTVSWLLEAAQLWAHEAKGLPTRMGKCEARRLGG
jgi:hypothetical protein